MKKENSIDSTSNPPEQGGGPAGVYKVITRYNCLVESAATVEDFSYCVIATSGSHAPSWLKFRESQVIFVNCDHNNW